MGVGNNAASCGLKLWAKAIHLKGVFVRPKKWSGKLCLWRRPDLEDFRIKKGKVLYFPGIPGVFLEKLLCKKEKEKDFQDLLDMDI